MSKKYKIPEESPTLKVSEPTVAYNVRPSRRTRFETMTHQAVHEVYAMPDREMTQEDLWRAIEQDSELLLKPSEIVDDGDETIDLEEAREILLRTVREEYARP